MIRRLFLASVLTISAPVSAQISAQDGPAADLSGIIVPDLSNSDDPAVVANGWKYFVFRKDGVTFVEARADVAECQRFQQPASWASVTLPDFIPWRRRAAREVEQQSASPYGVIGGLIGAAVEGTLTRRDLQSRMRRCMETRGYTRYGIAEETWETINAMPPDRAADVLAKIAAGPDFGGKVPDK